MMTPTPANDSYLHSGPLDTLASMTGGARIAPKSAPKRSSIVSAASCPASIASASRRTPTDADGKGRRMKVQVARRQRHRPRPGNLRRAQLRRSRLGGAARPRARSANRLDRHRPARHQLSRRRSRGSQARQDGAHGRGLARRAGRGDRAAADPRSQRLQLLAGEQPIGEPRGDNLVFTANVPVAPGTYVARVAVIDGAGRIGSVDHRIDAHRAVLGRSPRATRCCCACRRRDAARRASRSTPSRRTNGWPSRSISTASGRCSERPRSISTSPPRADGPSLVKASRRTW